MNAANKNALIVRSLLGCLCGILLSLSFAPYKFWPLALISPGALCFIINDMPIGRSTFICFCFGCGLFSHGMHWIYRGFLRDHFPFAMALLLTFTLIFLLSSVMALMGLVYKLLWRRPHWNRCLLGFPLIWVWKDWLQSNALSGLPWLLIGYSQVSSPLQGWAPLLGVYGVTFLSVQLSVALIRILITQNKRVKYGMAGLSVICFIISAILSMASWHVSHQSTDQYRSVALIQSNIDQTSKWQQHNFQPIVDKQINMTRAYLNDELIVWPETAIPDFYQHRLPLIQKLDYWLRQNNTELLTGILTQNHRNSYNSVILLGHGEGNYRKHKLVPFGEYSPFQKLKHMIIGGHNHNTLVGGENFQKPISTPIGNIGVLICYEIAYPHLVIDKARSSGLMVIVSNNAWFNGTKMLKQYQQIAQFRAMETGRYLMVTTNSGITSIINSNGSIVKQLPPYKDGVLSMKIPVNYTMTPISWLGYDKIIALLCLLTIISLLVEIAVRKRRITQI